MNSITLDLTIESPEQDTVEKIQAVADVLCKALGVRSNVEVREVSPYLAVRELEEVVGQEYEDRLNLLRDEIVERWLHRSLSKATKPFKLNGQIHINPKTGNPLTKKEWDIIVHDLESGMAWVFGQSQQKMSAVAVALGLILKTMSTGQALVAPLKSFGSMEALAEKVNTPLFKNVETFARRHSAEHIVDLSTKGRKAIAQTILGAQQDRLSPQELEQRLFERFGDLNRDWRRIASTEINTNFNNGYLTTELEVARGEGREHSFMVGHAAPTACDWCLQNVRNKMVVLMGSPPGEGDTVTLQGVEYVVIWPGKTNAGRGRDNWWVASGTQHPHCRCTWSPYDPETAEMEKKFWHNVEDSYGPVEKVKRREYPEFSTEEWKGIKGAAERLSPGILVKLEAQPWYRKKG